VKVTVDINVLLDVFQKREPHYAASAQVVSMVTAGTLTGVCAAHGLTTLYYLVRKHASKPDAEAAMDQVLRHSASIAAPSDNLKTHYQPYQRSCSSWAISSRVGANQR
jgi:predicted nucleic acid-binding protein